MKKHFFIFLIFALIISSCNNPKEQELNIKIRNVVDTVGFAQYAWQMDSILKRMDYKNNFENSWRVVITPHDDYAYVGSLYPKLLNGIKAKTVILFGVAHKARNYNLENKIVFDSFDVWASPFGSVKVSDLRNQIILKLNDSLYTVHDEMHSVEHSLEAIIPFLQYQNREVEIVPILIPYMSFDKMGQIAESLAKAISIVMKDQKLNWGTDIAMVISTDAVHYGDEDWGGKNYAPYGTDSLGLIQVKNHELEIIQNCLVDEITQEKIKKFFEYTVQKSDYKEYKWTWCGRYSVPFGLLTSVYLDDLVTNKGVNGTLIGYSNSIDHPVLKVDDLQMGTTAPANNHHFVGYAAVGFE